MISISGLDAGRPMRKTVSVHSTRSPLASERSSSMTDCSDLRPSHAESRTAKPRTRARTTSSQRRSEDLPAEQQQQERDEREPPQGDAAEPREVPSRPQHQPEQHQDPER